MEGYISIINNNIKLYSHESIYFIYRLQKIADNLYVGITGFFFINGEMDKSYDKLGQIV